MSYQSKTQKRPFPYVALCLIVVAVLVLVVLAYTVLDSTGVLGRWGTAAESDNFRVSDNELSVYEYQVALNQFTTEYWYYKYGLMEDTYGIATMFSDEYSYAYYMLSMYKGTGAFSADAYSYAQQYLVYCEGAKEAGVELDDEDLANIDAYIESLEATAKSGNMSLTTFLKNYIGKGVSKSDVRSAMKKYQLGVKYAEILNDKFSDAVTDEEIKDYRDENKGEFYSTKLLSYVLVDKALEAKAKECKTVEELKALLIDYYAGNLASTSTDKKDEAETEASTEVETEAATEAETEAATEAETEASTEASTETETSAGGNKTDAKVESKFDTLYKEKIEDAKVETEDDKATVKAKVIETLKAIYELGEDYTEHYKSTATDDYGKAAYAIVDGLKKELDTQFGKINENNSSSYVDLSDDAVAEKATDLQKWLFGDEGRQAGDVNVIKVETTSGSGSSATQTTTYTWYVVKETMVLNTEKTKDAYFAQLSDDKDDATTDGKKMTAEEKANAMFEALSADKTTDKFDELAVKYGATTSTALRESITESSAKSTAEKYAEWLYSADRKEGDITLIKTDDETPKYFVAYFVEENEETWMVNARAAITSEKLEEWFEAGVEKYHVTVDTKAPETTAEAATQAATEAATQAVTEAATEAVSA